MDAAEYNLLRNRINEWHAEQLRLIDSRRAADLTALHRVCELAGFDPNKPTVSTTTTVDTDLPGDHWERGGLSKIVTTAVGLIGADVEFSFHDVQQVLADSGKNKEDFPANAITQVLRRLVELGKIAIVEQGQGRRPTTYIRNLHEEEG